MLFNTLPTILKEKVIQAGSLNSNQIFELFIYLHFHTGLRHRLVQSHGVKAHTSATSSPPSNQENLSALGGMWQEPTRSDWRLCAVQKRDLCNNLVTLLLSHTLSHTLGRTGLFKGARNFALLNKMIIWPLQTLECFCLLGFKACRSWSLICYHRRRPLEVCVAHTPLPPGII